MNNIKNILTLGAALAATALISPTIASAQEMAFDGGAGQQIQGTVSSIDGTWNITVNDSSGYSDNIALHQGTIINPTGLTLEPGMNVTIDGYSDGSSFDATEIDTPYQYNGPAPVAVYYGSGAWYPGYAEGWGPSFTLAFNLGNRQFEQRSFYAGGQIRRAMTPPAGWENRPHGFIGNANASQRHTAYAAPQRGNFAQPQQQRTFAQPQQQQRTFAQPQQQRNFAPQQQQQQRTFAAPQQRQRSFEAPQQQPQQRNFAAMRPQMPQARTAPPAQRGGQDRGSNDGGGHQRG
jgi:hypothetical protein